MSILCIGQAVYDLTFPTDSTIVENQKYRIFDRHECMGAPAANAAYLCGLWGIHTSLIARIGDDLFGKEIVQTLQSAGVDTTGIRYEEQQKTSISCIMVNKKNGNRTILNAPLKETDFHPVWPESPKVILLDGHEQAISLEALRRFPKACSIMDAGSFKPELTELFQQVDFLVCSQDFAYQYTQIVIDLQEVSTLEATFDALEKLNSKQIVITLGEQGSVYKQAGKIVHIPAFPTKPVDTTGAGDIFHGAFAYGLHQDDSIEKIIVSASAAAALSVEKLGGQTAVPEKEKVDRFLQEKQGL
ncbi:ribokinase [Enterococcus florum]|uniref:Ribokinase n=1 Tax=Enterococcus florum TaxID=2480627 RepID=A0A4P5PFE4_9ENTE|nr:carbohydrate kinase family protein [Enterococcus florum]GCF94968.1 ribokinase [Enterococcus florum]